MTTTADEGLFILLLLDVESLFLRNGGRLIDVFFYSLVLYTTIIIHSKQMDLILLMSGWFSKISNDWIWLMIDDQMKWEEQGNDRGDQEQREMIKIYWQMRV